MNRNSLTALAIYNFLGPRLRPTIILCDFKVYFPPIFPLFGKSTYMYTCLMLLCHHCLHCWTVVNSTVLCCYTQCNRNDSLIFSPTREEQYWENVVYQWLTLFFPGFNSSWSRLYMTDQQESLVQRPGHNTSQNYIFTLPHVLYLLEQAAKQDVVINPEWVNRRSEPCTCVTIYLTDFM